jgi:hypothetical protein
MSALATTPVYGESFLAAFDPPTLERDAARWSWSPTVDAEAVARLMAPFEPGAQEPIRIHTPKRPACGRSVLLFGCQDPAYESLLAALRARRIPYASVDWELLAAHGDVHLELLDDAARGVLSHEGQEVDLSGVGAAFYVPHDLDVTEELLRTRKPEDYRSLLTLRRWRMALEELHALLPGVTWLPATPSECGDNPQRKLSELFLARRLGLHVPETICSNDAQKVAAFQARHEGRVLFREWTTRRVWKSGDAMPACFHVRPGLEHEDESLVSHTPIVLQEYVEKDYELRVMIVGSDVRAVRIDSQDSIETAHDWRTYDLASCPFRPTSLPPRVAERLVRLCSKLNLGFACADLVCTPSGRHVLLEVNRPGSWGFFSAIAGLDLPDLLAQHLLAAATEASL